MSLTKDLLQFCETDRQREILQAVLDEGGSQSGSHKRAAKALGVNRSTISQTIRRITTVAEKRGFSPEHDMTHTCPESFTTTGVSTRYDDEGNFAGQWVKTSKTKDDQLAQIRDVITEWSGDIKPIKRIKAPKKTESDLLTFYPLADTHIGLAALDVTENFTREWDLNVAKGTILDSVAQMLDASPDSKECVVGLLGDFMHWDSLYPVTPSHGHILDAACFSTDMYNTAFNVARNIVLMCLEKHEKVHMLITEGNHDQFATCGLKLAIKTAFENNPRVEINPSNTPYAAFQHGKTMICCHHGHLKKPEQLHKVMCTDFSVMWGKTTHRYGHVGHRHSTKVFEDGGAIITQHATLAPRDRYASRHGFSSLSYVKATTYLASGGEHSQQIIHPYQG